MTVSRKYRVIHNTKMNLKSSTARMPLETPSHHRCSQSSHGRFFVLTQQARWNMIFTQDQPAAKLLNPRN